MQYCMLSERVHNCSNVFNVLYKKELNIFLAKDVFYKLFSKLKIVLTYFLFIKGEVSWEISNFEHCVN